MTYCYGHAALLASRCARGCDRVAACISEVDGKNICAYCAAAEITEGQPPVSSE